jgi:hypothetical protein
VALWNSRGIEQGAEERKIPANERNCTTFKWGSESKCNISKSSVGVGVVVLYVLQTSYSSTSGFMLT